MSLTAASTACGGVGKHVGRDQGWAITILENSIIALVMSFTTSEKYHVTQRIILGERNSCTDVCAMYMAVKAIYSNRKLTSYCARESLDQ